MPVSPAMAEDLASSVSSLYEQVEMVLIQHIRTAAADGIDAPSWVEQKLSSLGSLQAGIRSVVDALDKDSSGAVHQAVAEAYRRGQQAAVAELGALPAGVTQRVADDIPNAASIDRLAAALVSDARAAHLRILRESVDTYRDVIARASAAPLAGAQTRRQAAQSALNDFASRGVTGFVDRSGRSWNLNSYIEMATRSTVGRAAIEAHTDRLGAAGIELVVVSRAPEECPQCRPWEGKILTRSGGPGAHAVEVEHAIEDGRMVKVDVAGSLDEARAAGLMHPNCRHTVSIYLPGVTKDPKPVPARGTYEQSQQQRYLERQVRKWKRLSEAAMDEPTRKAANARVRGYQSRIRDLVDESGMPRKPHREKLAEPSPQQRADLAEQQPVKPPEPESKPEPAAPPEPQASVSSATRDRIDQARGGLPQDRDAWERARRTEVTPARLGYDRRISEFQAELHAHLEDRDRIIAQVEDEFRLRRTPKRKRANLRDEATRHVDSDIYLTRSNIEFLEEERDRFLAGEPGNYSATLTRMEEPTFKSLYQEDAYGKLLPPEEYERHLDNVLDVGGALADDLEAAYLNDSVLADLREEVARIAKSDAPDPDALRGAQMAVAVREAETVRKLLADVRRMGGKVNAEVASPAIIASRGATATKVRGDWEQLLAEALDHFPKEWLDRMRKVSLAMVGSDRAYYTAGIGVDGGDLLALDMSAPAWYNGAFSSYAAEVATHELGHRMEQYVPGLRELEYALVRRRATSNGVLDVPQELSALHPGSAYRKGELAYEDKWADPYTGKTYERHAPDDPASISSEAFQVGLQDLFGRSGRRFGDRELQQFALGCLALL